MRRALLLLLALFTTACGRAAPAAAPAPPPETVEIAYIGPAAPAHAFELALRRAGGTGAGRLRLAAVVMTESCTGQAELHAALTAGAQPAISAAAVAGCGSAGAPAVAMLRRLHLPSVLWGSGLSAVTWTAAASPQARPQAPALAGFVARYDRRAGLDPVACQDTPAFCSALAAAGLRVLPAPNLRRLPAGRPLAVWTDAPPLQAAALRRRLTAAGRLAPLEGSLLHSPAYLAAAGRAAAGTIAFTQAPPAADPAQLARLRGLFAQAPTSGDVQAYAAGQVLAAAVLAAGAHRTAIATHLATGVRSLPTVAGPVTFGPQGADVQAPQVSVAIAGAHGWVPVAAPAAATVSGSVY